MTNRPQAGGEASDAAAGIESARPTGADEVRCPCGSLLARRSGDVIELKCRRCRRCVFLRLLANHRVEVWDEQPAGGRT